MTLIRQYIPKKEYRFLFMDDFVNVMKALSDPNRVRIIKILQNKALCVCELQELLSIPQPAVSKHMKVLEKAGLVIGTKDGLWVYYSVDYGSNNPYAAALLGNLRHWISGDAQVNQMKKRLPDIRRHTSCKRS
jgi:ArsR family transcriptional regulator